jgi:hypothetical protein
MNNQIERHINHGNFINIFHPELRKKVAENYNRSDT